MAQIELRLSKRVEKETGKFKVLIRFFDGKFFDFYGETGVKVAPEHFEYFINRPETERMGVRVKDEILTATEDEAERYGYILRNSGIINQKERARIETDDIRERREEWKKLDDLKKYIIAMYEKKGEKKLGKGWLKEIIDRHNHPEKYVSKYETMTFYQLLNEYTKERNLADGHVRVFRVLNRMVARYVGFVNETDPKRKGWEWKIDDVTKDDLEDFFDYMRNEKQLSEEYPTLFARLMANYPEGVDAGHAHLQERGENTIIKMKARMKALCRYFVEKGYTTNYPFTGYKIGTATVGTPIYITIEERNRIAEADLAAKWATMGKEERGRARMPLKTLEEQRDIFVFQCLVGCRVSDLVKFTSHYIENGILAYTPHKTKDDGKEAMQARVPLHEKALAIIKKYRGADKHGRLLPFISPQRYNDAIKVIFLMAGVTRNVEIRNSLTGEPEIVPINIIASSHLARRTFIGNAYFKVQDPNLIGKMSGHVEGSEAFKRYRKIEDSTLKDVINLLG